MGASAAVLAAKFDHHLKKRGQLVTIYRPQRTAGRGGKVTENTDQVLGTAYAMFQFGEDARDQPGLLGINPEQACVAYFQSTAAPLLFDRCVVKDASGGWWLVVGRPNAQPLPTTVGVGVLLQWQADKPAGTP